MQSWRRTRQTSNCNLQMSSTRLLRASCKLQAPRLSCQTSVLSFQTSNTGLQSSSFNAQTASLKRSSLIGKPRTPTRILQIAKIILNVHVFNFRLHTSNIKFQTSMSTWSLTPTTATSQSFILNIETAHLKLQISNIPPCLRKCTCRTFNVNRHTSVV